MDYLEITPGKRVRVEANWNAIVAFLEARGIDTMTGLADMDKLSPSQVADLMAACINEGERLDGRETHYVGIDLGAMCSLDVITEFLRIYLRQSTPKLKASDEEAVVEDAEKKA